MFYFILKKEAEYHNINNFRKIILPFTWCKDKLNVYLNVKQSKKNGMRKKSDVRTGLIGHKWKRIEFWTLIAQVFLANNHQKKTYLV